MAFIITHRKENYRTLQTQSEEHEFYRYLPLQPTDADKIVIAVINGEFKVKHLQLEDTQTILMSANSDYILPYYH